jgi:hypothetical protein
MVCAAPFCALPTATRAQTCADMLPFVAGRFVTFNLTDAENRQMGKLTYRYDKEQIGNYKIERTDTYGRLRRTAEGRLQCLGNLTQGDWTPKILDLLYAYRDKQVSLVQNDLLYPATLQIGDALPDGQLQVTVSDNGRVTLEVRMTAAERRVEMQELIMAGGNTYTCWRIASRQTIHTTVNNQATTPCELRQVEWVAAGVGIIKTATYSMQSGKMMYGSLLNVLGNELPAPLPVFEVPTDPVILEIPTSYNSVPPSNN